MRRIAGTSRTTRRSGLARAATLWAALAALVLVVSVVVAVVSVPDDGPDADLRNGRVFIQDNLVTDGARQYAVWVAPDGTPYAGARDLDRDDWRLTNLAEIPGNPLGTPTGDDLHHVYVLGVDVRGHVHVAGNMHGDDLRYVRTTAPHDIDEWEAASLDGPSDRITYPRFVRLPDGTLLFVRRHGVAGSGATHVDRLDRSGGWRHDGALLDGTSTDESPYLHEIAVDHERNVVHLLFEWRTGTPAVETNDVAYARSRDGGRSWETSTGARLPTPITHQSSEVVLDTPPAGSGLQNQGGLAVDAHGRPHGVVVFDPPGPDRSIEHLWHSGTGWRRDRLDGRLLDGRPAVAAPPDGSVWMVGARGGALRAIEITPGGGDRVHGLGRVPPRWEVSFDGRALADRGDLQLLVPDGTQPGLRRVQLAARSDATGAVGRPGSDHGTAAPAHSSSSRRVA